MGAAFADVRCADPEGRLQRTLDSVQGNARLAEASLTEEIAAALDATDKDVEIGGAGLAAQAIELGLVDELRMFRYPVVVGGDTPFLPPVTDDVPLELIETRMFGSPRVIYERYGRAAMSRTDTADQQKRGTPRGGEGGAWARVGGREVPECGARNHRFPALASSGESPAAATAGFPCQAAVGRPAS